MLYFNTTAHELRLYKLTTWTTAYIPSGSAVSSFNSRTGGVNPADGDYTAAQIVVTPAGGITATRVDGALIIRIGKREIWEAFKFGPTWPTKRLALAPWPSLDIWYRRILGSFSDSG